MWVPSNITAPGYIKWLGVDRSLSRIICRGLQKQRLVNRAYEGGRYATRDIDRIKGTTDAAHMGWGWGSGLSSRWRFPGAPPPSTGRSIAYLDKFC